MEQTDRMSLGAQRRRRRRPTCRRLESVGRNSARAELLGAYIMLAGDGRARNCEREHTPDHHRFGRRKDGPAFVLFEQRTHTHTHAHRSKRLPPLNPIGLKSRVALNLMERAMGGGGVLFVPVGLVCAL
jgi:hypothetical protein